MDDNPSPPAGNDRGDCDPADPQLAQKNSSDRCENITPVPNNRFVQVKSLAVEFVVAGSIATGFWLLGEWLTSHGHGLAGGTFTFIAACLYFATAPLAVLKILPKPKTIWFGYGIVCVVLAIVFIRSTTEKIAEPQPIKQPRATDVATDQEWQPPELPPGCSNVTVFFGSMGIIYNRLVAEISKGTNGTKLLIKDVPEELLVGLDKMTNYSPRQRHMWIKMTQQLQIGGKIVSYPIVPMLISNRLYIDVEVPFLNERRQLVMSDRFDSELFKLPNHWDRNYSTNMYAYEVVNERTNPVLQVLYISPNEVFVCGIFIVDTNSILQTFGGPPQLLTASSYKFVNTSNLEVITNIADYIDTNSIGQILSNGLYNLPMPGQTAIFKYPSNRYPGVFADYLKPKPLH